MKKRSSMFLYGATCFRCEHSLIAPYMTEFLDGQIIRHSWQCPHCDARFESFPRFPAYAKSVKEVTAEVEVFPTLRA
jgi:hypothetical protein